MHNPSYKHITEAGYSLMKELKPGALIRVSWIEDPDGDAEWGGQIYDLEGNENNIAMFIEWMPDIFNTKDIITFKCLWEDKIYYSSTRALIEILKHEENK